MSISLIIPAYNYGRYIGESIESALGQSLAPTEIIVVDDGSTDNTAKVVAGFDGRVQYIRQENAGVSAARNRGVAESAGELLAFLDADDNWGPEKLRRQAELFAADGAVGLVHCGMREFDSETGETLGLRTEGMEGLVADELLLWERPAVNVSGSSIMVSRKAFEEAGRFDTRITCGEDWDLCYRIARRYKVGFVPEPLVNYRIHSAAAHHNVSAMEQGMGIFYDKAFAEAAAEVLALRDRAMGNYHRVLAGSYFQAGEYGRFLSHSAKSIVRRPANLGYFLSFPLRRFAKQR
jgi:glycosyltransferase involved in cell wall biosynthesis